MERRAFALPGERVSMAEYEKLRQSFEGITYATLLEKLKVRRAPDVPLSFDPMRVEYFDRVRSRMKLTQAEQDVFQKKGMVGVDPGQPYGMASAYLAIYTADLPVLVTTDSILHAMHRSFDKMLMDLELHQFTTTLQSVLESTRQTLAVDWRRAPVPALAESARDVDLYLTVAVALLGSEDTAAFQGVFHQEAELTRLLTAIHDLAPEDDFPLYGGSRKVDFSQFKPRGHYTKDPRLERYFRTMMWLGRVDLGFALEPLSPRTGLHFDATRELRDAALLALMLSRSGQLERLAGLGRAIEFFVGESDNAGPLDLAAALADAGIGQMSDLAAEAALRRLPSELAKTGAATQRIRSQVLDSPADNPVETPLSDVFQVMGQAFSLDSFVLSRSVFDSIVYRGEKQERFMPSGLDVMAAFGNDETLPLLKLELDKYHYGANLLAARTLIERQPPEVWDGNAYNVWLSAISKLDDAPKGTRFPSAMRTHAWQMKQLQTQLASWAELRHDTILYDKPSYTAYAGCEYPTGYVEPYPEAFARMALFAETARNWLESAKLAEPGLSGFLANFAGTARKLEALAQKELDARPFDEAERTFVKNTISLQWQRGGCTGPTPIYSGWYPQLLYETAPESGEPTVADVHTDPNRGQVLEEGVGAATFVVVAIDNARDRVAYVGPIYSYYEFASSDRLTDEAWQQRVVANTTPPRPPWTSAFQAPMVKRTIWRPLDTSKRQR
jgi:hypothetical protein